MCQEDSRLGPVNSGQVKLPGKTCYWGGVLLVGVDSPGLTMYDGIHECRGRPETYKDQPNAAYYRAKAKKSNDYHSGCARQEPRQQDRKSERGRFNINRPIVYGYR